MLAAALKSRLRSPLSSYRHDVINVYTTAASRTFLSRSITTTTEVEPTVKPDHSITENVQLVRKPLTRRRLALPRSISASSLRRSSNRSSDTDAVERETMGSGFVIGGNKILTNAHVVGDHTFVLVRKHGSPMKYKAQVEAVGHECDLAILTVESDKLWEGMNPLELGDIPFLQQVVAVVGHPQVHFRNKEWITFDHLVSMKKPNETALVRVLRDDKEHPSTSKSWNYYYMLTWCVPLISV